MFYEWLSMAYSVMLCSALWVNRHDFRMLGLSVAVGAGIFVPIPDASIPAIWYFECLSIELLVAMCAMQLRASGSAAIILFSSLLALMHLTGALVGPQPGFGPYRVIIPILETAELLICLVMSSSAMRHIKKFSGLDNES